MGLFDKVGDLAKQHESKIEQGIDQAGDFVDSKTGGKYAEHVDKAQDFANQQVDRFTGDGAADPVANPDNGAGPDDVPPTTPVPNP